METKNLLQEPDSIKTGMAERQILPPGKGIFIGLERAGRVPVILIPTSTASESMKDNGALHL